MTADPSPSAGALFNELEEEVYVFPASFAQQRLWFFDQLEPGSPFYNIPLAVRMQGRLDVSILQRCLNEIALRHETLRTTFLARDGQPVQVINPSGEIPLSITDLQDLPARQHEAEMQRLATVEARQPFDLVHGPLVRAVLVRLAEDDHVVLLTMHHIISDGWSIGVLLSEIAALYEAFSTGRPSPLPDLPIQYADYAQWQREWLKGQVLKEQLDYWKVQLGGGLPVLELPADRPRPAVQSFRGSTLSIQIPRLLTQALKNFCRVEGVTPFMALLAAFDVLLYRHSNQEDICVGTPLANRNRAEIEGLIGFFVNTLVMRTNLSGEPTFRELLARVRDTALNAYAHQDLPFESIVEALQPERDMSHNPLFQVMFILQNASVRAHELPGLTLSPIEAETGTATFDLTLSMVENEEGYDASVEYSTDLFDQATVRRLLEHFRVLLESIVTHPDQSIAELPILTEEERQQLLVEWNAAFLASPRAGWTLQQLFEAQVERTPQNIALVWPGVEAQSPEPASLTYRELNQRANQLAYFLEKLGVGPDKPVGICVNRSPDMVVGVLGVLKAGGAYLPMDPTYPPERLSFMLEDSQVSVLLTQSQLVAGLPPHHAQTLCLDTEGALFSKEEASNPPCVTGPDSLAYLIYTSGSTGKPKGVLLRQRNIVNAFLAWEEAYRLDSLSSHLQMANFAFDVFSGDLSRALCSGGKLVICPREYLLEAEKLYALMQQERVDCAEFVPAVLRNLAQYLEKTRQDLSFMRLLICGSDIWYVREYQSFQKLCGPQTRLVNSFGLTEATIDSSFYENPALDLAQDRLVPIGRPFANTRLYVLDGHLQPLPIGVPGELCVGGAGVAGGYLNRPELNAEKFIPDPFVKESGARLYRTGDMARFLPDGNVEFLGRMDYQVKIRGFRIETGEIEAVIRQHPAIRDAVVVAVSGNGAASSSAQRLAAYLVSDIAVDRVPLRVKCSVIESGDGRQPLDLTTTDISYHGACLTGVPAHWAAGQGVQLCLTLPDALGDVCLNGSVAWREGQEAGICLNPSPAEQDLLRQTVKFVTEIQGVVLTDLRNSDPRVPLRTACQVQFGDGTLRELTLENLSRGGLRLSGEKSLWVKGQRIRIHLQVPESIEDLWLKGIVWWTRDERAGIKFETTPLERELLVQGVEALLKAQGFSLAHLRSFLKVKLPDYMVPSAFVLLETLPLTPNGKVDRKALPAPDWSRQEWETEFIAPRTPVEEMLAGIWAQVLDAEQISVQDNFFELGGHSLLATQLISRLREAFQVDLPLRRIFEYPTIATLAEQIEIAQRSEAGLQAQPILPVARSGDLPLSFSQQRLWFLDQLEPGSPFYNLPEALRLTGALDRDAFERSLKEILRRHEVLRTSFVTLQDGRPRQVIAPDLELPLEVVDLCSLPAEEREKETLRMANAEAQLPFDLAHGPLLRFKLLRLGEEEQVVLLTMHHIIGDDWSSNVLIQEFSLLYEAFANGRPSPLPELPIQYADFAAWQRNWLKGEVLETQLNYWKEQLQHSPPLLELPTDRPRPAVQTYRGAYQTFSLPARLSQGLKALCQREGVTLFMLLLAAFETLLYRHSRQEDFNVGTPIANRNRADIENLIGFFVNTLVLPADLSGEPGFTDLLKRVRETSLGAYAHQDLPFEMIVDALQPQRDMSHSPLFQVMFVIQNAPMRAREVQGLTVGSLEAHSGTAKFDLTLFMLEEGERLGGAFEYNTDLFDAATIAHLSQHFSILLQAILDDPSQSIATLPLLSDPERHQLLVEWNDTAAPFPDHLCAHQLFEQQALRTPHAPAVSFHGQTLSFDALNRRANRLAHFLQAQNVSPDTLVGVCLPRSPDLVVALLATLKSGAAYLPLDPSYPPERLAFMLQDAQAPLLLTTSSLAATLAPASLPHTRFVPLDAAGPALEPFPEDDPLSSVTPANLAYVIYTSGSTGKPKGAMISHRGLVNYLTWTRLAYPLALGQGAPVHSSISFDLTVTAFWAPLMQGRPIWLLPEEEGVEALSSTLAAQGDFSLVKITPAHLQLLGQQLSPSLASSRTRAFIIGGENLTHDHLAFWLTHAPHTALVNEYGPTETVVGCCCYWAPHDCPHPGVIPIGRPILNTRLYVLDAHLQPVPVGVPGELFIGGVGVGRGYLNRPDLTRERFLPDPFSTDPAERLYRTGDLVRYLPDGNLECLGRIDFQVKIRGFRVELGEIEAALSRHPAIRENVVWVREDNGLRRLVAYLVPADPASPPSASELRDFLRRSLPDYMLPAAFVLLQALPLTANGKVDRKALPAPEAARPDLDAPFAPPSSPAEHTLAEIWRQVLALPQVGVHDNFFELGGDSILSIQIVARANQAGLRLSPRQLFEAPTIAGLAALASSAPVPLAEQGPVTGSLPLTPIQRWFFAQDFPNPHHFNQSLLFALKEPLQWEALEAALQALLAHHDALRLRFTPSEEGWQAQNAPVADEEALVWIDLAALPEAEQSREIEARSAQLQTGLDITHGPLLRAACFCLGQGRADRLLLIVHHLAIDGVSWRILLEDLQSAYAQALGQQVLSLPPKSTSFRTWAGRLMEYAASPRVQEERAYWSTLAASAPAPLPRDFSGGQNSEASTASLAVSLSQEDTQALLHHVHAAYHTEINDLLLAALARALHHWSGSSSALVDLEGHGREPFAPDLDPSRTLGWFTTLYPVRLDLPEDPSPAEAIKAVKEQLRAVPGHGLGYGLLAYADGEAEKRPRAQAEISFNYLGQFDQALPEESPFTLAAEERGPERDPHGLRTHLIQIDGGVSAGQLSLEWSFSREIHRAETIRALAEEYIAELSALIAHCLDPQAGGFTPSDFTDFGWEQGDLDDILGAIGKL